MLISLTRNKIQSLLLPARITACITLLLCNRCIPLKFNNFGSRISNQSVRSMSLTRDAERNAGAGYEWIIGVDEAGRGPLAGPVVAAACYINEAATSDFEDGVIDSKQTSEQQREQVYQSLTSHPGVIWAASVVSHTEIDEVNILQATMNGMRRSTADVVQQIIQKQQQPAAGSGKGTSSGPTKRKAQNSNKKSNNNTAQTTISEVDNSFFLALIDGNRVPDEMPIPAKAIIKGDGSIFSIAAASIIAKVTRDHIMVELDKQYPEYKLAQHKGYPTAEHRALLIKHGASDIHRRSYGPVKRALEAQNSNTTSNDSSGGGTATNEENVSVPTRKARRLDTITTSTAIITGSKQQKGKSDKKASAKPTAIKTVAKVSSSSRKGAKAGVKTTISANNKTATKAKSTGIAKTKSTSIAKAKSTSIAKAKSTSGIAVAKSTSIVEAESTSITKAKGSGIAKAKSISGIAKTGTKTAAVKASRKTAKVTSNTKLTRKGRNGDNA